MTPYFSIIIPVYNVAPYLRECLDSVLAQTFTDWEAICVDDGSRDGSGAILDEYSAKDLRFHVIHQLNGGVSAARNAALEIGLGSFVIFLDSDDILAEDGLSILHESAKLNLKADMLHFGMVRFNDGDMIDWNVSSREAALVDISKRLTYSDVMKDTLGLAYRRELVGKLRFANCAFHEDRIFYAEALVKANAYFEVGHPVYAYRMRAGSATHSPERRAEETQCAIFAFPRILATLIKSKRELDDAIVRIFSNYILETIPFQICTSAMCKQANLWNEFFSEIGKMPKVKGLRNIRWILYKRLKSRLTVICFGVTIYWLKIFLSSFCKHLHIIGEIICNRMETMLST